MVCIIRVGRNEKLGFARNGTPSSVKQVRWCSMVQRHGTSIPCCDILSITFFSPCRCEKSRTGGSLLLLGVELPPCLVLMSSHVLFPNPIDQALSPSESLAGIQIFLNVSLACISYTRRLIPWQASCFRTRYVDQITAATACTPLDPYACFCALDTQPPNPSQELRVLVKGGHEYADQILDMLVTTITSPWTPLY